MSIQVSDAETGLTAEQALDELKGILSAETAADVVRAVRSTAERKPLVWTDQQGKIHFAPMTFRAMQRLQETLQQGMVVSP